MELRQLEYFKQIAEKENISSASKALHVAQPFLSRTLKNLEEELGVLLFDRRGKSIHINENGRALLRYATEILALADEALETFKTQSTAVLRIGMFNSTSMFPGLIARFGERYPTIKLSLNKVTNPDAFPENCDVMIHASENLAGRLPSLDLLDEDCLIGMSRNHPLAGEAVITLQQLRCQPLLLLERKNTLGQLTHSYCEALGLAGNISLQCDSQQTLTSLVAEGMGLAFFPSRTWKIESEEILLRPIEGHRLSRKIYLSTPPGARSYVTKTFCRFVEDYFSVDGADE